MGRYRVWLELPTPPCLNRCCRCRCCSLTCRCFEPVSADWDGDGDPDLVLADGSGGAFFYENRVRLGQGLVETTTTFLSASDCGGQAVAFADYDADGNVDLIMAGKDTGNAICLWKGSGSGSFSKVSSPPFARSGNPRAYGFAWADYDGDSKLDLLVVYGANTGNTANELFKQGSDGSFSKITSGTIATDTAQSYSAAWGDYNHDGCAYSGAQPAPPDACSC